RPIALVSSGGTAADLEIHSVRCLDNFSTGKRGAISVEELLKRGYAVIHLWRRGSASPYGRVLSQAIMALIERQSALEEGRIMTISFRSVEEYLAKLQLSSESLRDSQALAMFFLCGAVSDFYVPLAERSTHKIQSQSNCLNLKLWPVPKVMGLLRRKWAPDAFVCSFKLETDVSILRRKAEGAVEKYGCHMVVGNLLKTRYDQVYILAP
ncbi:DNA/pantothenate metabolism flavo protein, partial [Fragilariopsis cylindrus CCMP1102]